MLVVDDAADLRFTLSAQLAADGFEVVAAASGERALAAAANALPGLAIVDLLMPGMDSFELARQLRLLGDISIIILTALDDEDTLVRGFDSITGTTTCASCALWLPRYRMVAPGGKLAGPVAGLRR